MEDDNRPAIKLLQSFQLINGLGRESLSWIAQELTPLSLAPDAILTEENKTNRSLYFVISGDIDVQKSAGNDSVEKAASLTGPTVVGEMSCLLARAAIATVRATSAVEGWKLDTRTLKNAPPKLYLRERLLERVLKLVASRLETTNQSILQLLKSHQSQDKLTIEDLEEFTDTWKAGLAFQESFQDLDESWSFD